MKIYSQKLSYQKLVQKVTKKKLSLLWEWISFWVKTSIWESTPKCQKHDFAPKAGRNIQQPMLLSSMGGRERAFMDWVQKSQDNLDLKTQ